MGGTLFPGYYYRYTFPLKEMYPAFLRHTLSPWLRAQLQQAQSTCKLSQHGTRYLQTLSNSGRGNLVAGAARLGANRLLLSSTAAVAALFGSALAFQQPAEAHSEKKAGNSDWPSEISSMSGNLEVLNKEILLQQDHPFLEDDHMFAAFVSNGIVNDMSGYYNTEEKKFYSVISLGREVAGFPKVVHGGLTAAIFDETFGGLLFSLKQDRVLKFWGPAYTVHLEVDYKSRIDAGKTVLCTTEIESTEGRKIWMKAKMSDGPDGKTYATARALFVVPKPMKMLKDVGRYLVERAFPSKR